MKTSKFLWIGLGIAAFVLLVVLLKKGVVEPWIGNKIQTTVNVVVLESNPMPGGEVRPGIIEYDRDPEKFLINYVFKSIMSGIETSITIIEIPK